MSDSLEVGCRELEMQGLDDTHQTRFAHYSDSSRDSPSHQPLLPKILLPSSSVLFPCLALILVGMTIFTPLCVSCSLERYPPTGCSLIGLSRPFIHLASALFHWLLLDQRDDGSSKPYPTRSTCRRSRRLTVNLARSPPVLHGTEVTRTQKGYTHLCLEA